MPGGAVDPRYEATVALGRLADAKAPVVAPALEAAPVPDQLEVGGQVERVEELVLKDHVAHCIEHAIASGDRGEQRRKVAELMEVLGRVQN